MLKLAQASDGICIYSLYSESKYYVLESSIT